MSPVVQPMTFEELAQIHREEMKAKSLTPCRPDLYHAMADLLNRLRQEYDRQVAVDPDSVMSEGANLRKKNAETISKVIISLRTRKVCNKAVLSADGAAEQLSSLTPEERELYNQVMELSKKHIMTVDRYRGKKVDTHIDEPPVPVKKTEDAPVIQMEEEAEEEPFIEESFDDIPEPETAVGTTEPEPEILDNPEPPRLETMVLRILEDLPPFVGPDRNYELHKEDIVTLPTPMAMALINSQKAVSISPVHRWCGCPRGTPNSRCSTVLCL